MRLLHPVVPLLTAAVLALNAPVSVAQEAVGPTPPAVTAADAPDAGPALAAPAPGAHVRGRVGFRWGSSTGHTSYQLSVAPDAGFERAVVVKVQGLHHSLLLDSGAWFWRVRATDGAGSAWSHTRTVRVTAPATTRSAAPRRLAPHAAVTVRTADPRFSWAPTGGRSRYDLRLSRRHSMAASTTWTAGRSGRTVRLDRGAWFWQVRAGGDGTRLNGLWSTPRRVVVAPTHDVYAPTRPRALSVQEVSSTSVTVSFGASTDDSGKVGYAVWANGVRVATSTATEGVVARLACGTTYTLVVRAVDTAGNRSPASPEARARTHSCSDLVAPDAPADVSVAQIGQDSVTLTWAAAQDPGNGPVEQYVVQRDGRTVAGTDQTSYTFTGLGPAERHSFAVRSKDRVGNLSPASTPVTATTAPPPQATGDVRPYVLATDSASLADAQSHYRDLRQIYPTFFEVGHTGAVTGSGQTALTRWFQIRGVRVMPRFHTEDAGVIESIASSATSRSRLVDEIASAVHTAGYDGANLDFEMTMPAAGVDGLTKQQRWDRLRTGYATFVEQLAGELHADGKALSVSVAVNWCSRSDPSTKATTYCADSQDSSALKRPRPYLYDYARIASAADELWLLSWGLHWATSEPGAVADLAWLEGVRSYFADVLRGRPDLLDKVTLGTQLYGFDWSYRVARRDDVSMPGGKLATAPACGSSNVAARPRYRYEGDTSRGTLHVSWLCNTRIGLPLEYDDQSSMLATLGVTPTYDATAGESTYTLPDPDVPGAVREGWFADSRAVAARARLVDAAGWHVGLWRLGHEDQAMWTDDGLSRGR